MICPLFKKQIPSCKCSFMYACGLSRPNVEYKCLTGAIKLPTGLQALYVCKL